MEFVLRLEGEEGEGAMERWRQALANPLKLRSTQSTQRNDVSSRSHSIFTVTLVDEEKIRKEKEEKAREEAAKKLEVCGGDLSSAKFDFENPPPEEEEEEEEDDDEVDVSHPAYSVVNKKIRLVDLAGSEQNADTGTMAALDHKESADINTALSALKQCIRSHKSGKKAPFRAHLLTRILRDCFVDSEHFTVIIATVR